MICERILLIWLNEAYDIEQALLELIDRYNNVVEDEELKGQIESRTSIIEEHSAKILENIEMLGGESVSNQTQIGSRIRNLYDFTDEDEEGNLLRHAIINFGGQYFERAIFRAILNMAGSCHNARVIELCKYILSDEEKTQEQIEQEITGIAIEFINRKVVEGETINFSETEEDQTGL